MEILIALFLLVVVVGYAVLRRKVKSKPEFVMTKEWCVAAAEREGNLPISAGVDLPPPTPNLEAYRRHTLNCVQFEGQCICSRPPQHSYTCTQFEGHCICGFDKARNQE